MRFFRPLLVAGLLCQSMSSIAQHPVLFSDVSKNTNAISTNPALVHLNKGEWAASILSFDGDVVSNTGSISTKNLFHVNANFLRQNVLGTSKISTGAGLLSIKGPSLAYGLTPKLTVIATTRTRFHSNYWKADGRLISEIGEVVKVPQEYPYVIKREQMQMVAAVFSELGITASYLAYENDRSSLHFGGTLNVVNGAASTSIAVPTLTGTIKRINSYLTSLTNATGSVSTQTSGEFLGAANLRNLLHPQQVSISTTLGVMYEYRRDKTGPPLFKFGLSINDIGRLKFRADSAYSKSYNINIPVNKDLFFNNNFNNSTFSQTTRVFDKYPDLFEKTNVRNDTYLVGLPTTIQVVADVRLAENFFAGGHGVLSLKGKNDIRTLRTNSSVAIAPRWETGNWAVGVSLGYQEFGGAYSGLSVKAGPVFLSGNTLLSGTIARTKQLNLAAGVILPLSTQR